MTSSFGTMMQELRCKDELLNVGTRWTIEEDNKLVQEITDNKTYEEIALEHNRTVYSIQLRVISRIIYPKIKDDLDIDMEKVALEYNIGTKEFLYNINKLKMKATENRDKPVQKPSIKPNHDDEPTNKQILEYLHLFTFQTPIFNY
jgi:hypothetical protein